MIKKNFTLNVIDSLINPPAGRYHFMTRALMSLFAAFVFMLAGAVPAAGQEIKGQRPARVCHAAKVMWMQRLFSS